MLHFDKIEISEGIDVNKTSTSSCRSCLNICLYFLYYSFKFQSNVYNEF